MDMPPETCDVALMRRYSRTAWRWGGTYHRGLGGLGGVLASYAVRKSKCHRFVTDAVDLEVNRLAEERKAAAEARASTFTGPVPVGTVPEALAEMATSGALWNGGDN
jgi:hypothetical protein